MCSAGGLVVKVSENAAGTLSAVHTGVWEDPWIGDTPAGKGLDPKFSRQVVTKSLNKMHVLGVQCTVLEIRVYCTDPR